jgi:hypothetical protein
VHRLRALLARIPDGGAVKTPIVKTCSCGREYTQETWNALPLVGFSAAEDPDEMLEQRNCVCTSTCAVAVMGPGFWLWLCEQRISEAREEAHRDLPSLSRSYVERAQTCLDQARELLKILADQRSGRAQAAE